jgi:ParB family chromosome partitioning protein
VRRFSSVSDRSKKVGLPAKRRMRHDRHFVDELSQRMGEGIGRMVRVTAISANTDQPRTNLGDLDDLIASISKHGILEPLLVRPRDGGYQLVSGERRFHAAMQVGLSELPCIELDVNDDEALEIALVENLQRRDLNAFEEAEGFRTLVHKYSYTHEQVADAIGRSRVTVTESLKILDIPDQIRARCRHADITAKGMLLEIAKAEDPQIMLRLIEEIVQRRLDRAALRARRQQLTDGSEADLREPTARPGRSRPYRFRFRAPDRPYSLSMSFRTDHEPDPQQVIQALEEVLEELRASLEKN